ncbi:MAG: oligosaccharide flippase family protein, partial [Anaerolineae bacterium]|nr:oligosaccharide flippase family protein [Anaerolineae bacterium]
MTTANRLSRNTLILLVSNIGSALLLFALSAIIGRAYGKEGLGVYSTAMAWVFPLSLIAEFGLNTLLTREIARQPERERAYLTTAV